MMRQAQAQAQEATEVCKKFLEFHMLLTHALYPGRAATRATEAYAQATAGDQRG